VQKIAETILGQVKDMVPGRFDTALASERTHPHVDWKAYHAVRAQADQLGFDHLADVDVVSLRHDPSIMKRAVLAVFVSNDGVNVLGHYRLPLRWTFKGIMGRFMGGRGDMFDVGTQFGGRDGVTLATTTARAAAVWDQPEFIVKETLATGTPLEQVVTRHRERVRDYLSQHPDARPVAVQTIGQIVDLNRTSELRKLEWRRQRGWITREELARFGKLNDAQLDQLYEAIQTAARAEGYR